MDSYKRGPLWLLLLPLMLPQCLCDSPCSVSCACRAEGLAVCRGDLITDTPRPMPLDMNKLILQKTRMNVINERSLANMTLLLRFALTHSHLHTIHPLAFQVAPQLISIKLSSNDLKTLPAQVFRPLTALEELLLDENQFETIYPELSDLVTLKSLDLSSNKLKSLHANVFTALTNLTYLNIGGNRLKALPPTIFHTLGKLKYLYMSVNEIKALAPGMFDSLVDLLQLKIHQNQITSLPPFVFFPLGNLKTLTLSSNRLQQVPRYTFYNKLKLSKLTLYSNPLLSLPEELMGPMPEMKEIYLFNTSLTTVPGNLFSNMSRLVNLSLHLNPKLKELPVDLFCCLPYLQKLSLRSNNLFYLNPHLFSRLTSLKTLLLNDNQLESLPENLFWDLRWLETIELKNNLLRTLPEDIFTSNTGLGAVTLANNPWECMCGIRGIARWIRQNMDEVKDNLNVTCESPMYQLLRRLSSLQEQEFDNCDATYGPSFPPTLKNRGEPTQKINTDPAGTPALTTPPASTTSSRTSQVTVPLSTKSITLSTSAETTTPIHTVTTTAPGEEFPLITETQMSLRSENVFYEQLVMVEGPEYVHHNRHRGWVYVWYLPSDRIRTGFLMLCHILLVTTGLFLILASLYVLYHLDKTMDTLKAEYCRNRANYIMLSGQELDSAE